MHIKTRVAHIVAGLTLITATGCETLLYGLAGSNGLSSAPDVIAAGEVSEPALALSCPDGSRCLSVLSFNMQHRDSPIQLDAMAHCLRADRSPSPDFILCQEVVFGRPKRRGEENTAVLLANLLEYHSQATSRRGGSEGVAILSRYPFDHYSYKHLEAEDGFLSGGFPRVSVMGEFIVPNSGRVRVVNVHLAHRRSRHKIRREQLEETLEWIAQRERAVPADITILGGDFNIEPEWEELAVVRDPGACAGLYFHDYNSRIPTSGRLGKPYRRVDYVFVAAPYRQVESVCEAPLWPQGMPTRDGSARFWISDHLPLLHVFAIGPSDQMGETRLGY